MEGNISFTALAQGGDDKDSRYSAVRKQLLPYAGMDNLNV